MCVSHEPDEKEAASKSSSPGTVLVVEDDRNARKAITRILRLQGFVPFEAGTVSEAMTALDGRPQWVLLDLMLPDGCGSQVLDRIVQDRLPIKVCITTGCVESKVNGLRARGAKHIMLKPLDVDRLLSLLCDSEASG
jgi:DNA-binding response OmpR family regulator